VDGSKEFIEFLGILGEFVELKGFSGYAGGLDVKREATGKHSVYTTFQGVEIMYVDLYHSY
jgi:RAP1 GTPase activating protein 1